MTVLGRLLLDAKCLGCIDDRRQKLFRTILNHFPCFRTLLRDDDRYRGLDDSGFLSRDFAQGVAQEILVIEIDARDDRDDRRENIRGVETAAETNFECTKLNALLSEIFERHRGHGFEVSWMS